MPGRLQSRTGRRLHPGREPCIANDIEKTIADQGFDVKRLEKADIKRFLALYFDASMNGVQIADPQKNGTNRMILLLEAGKQIASIRIGNEDTFLKVDDELIKYGIDDCYWNDDRTKADFWSTEDCVHWLQEAIEAVKSKKTHQSLSC